MRETLGGLLLFGVCQGGVYWHPSTVRLRDEYPLIKHVFIFSFEVILISIIKVILESAWMKTELFKWLQSHSKDRETKRQVLPEKQPQPANQDLMRLRYQLGADLEAVYQAKGFEDTGLACTGAIESLNAVMTHTIYHGDKYVSAAVKIGDRQLKVKLYTQRAAAHFEIGRYRSAANDYGRVLASATNKRVQASTLGGDRKEMFLRKGHALIMAGDVGEANEAFHQGILQQGSDEWNSECTRGVKNVLAVRADTASAKGALESMTFGVATMSAKRALAKAPNYETAQKLVLDALLGEGRWLKARRMCEEWACLLETCNWKGGRTVLGRFEHGGGPPGKCISAMHVSLREGYCKALRVCGTRSDLNDALSVARELSLPWAMNLARQEQTHDTDQLQGDLLCVRAANTILEYQIKQQTEELLAVKEGHKRELARFENERKSFTSQMRYFETFKRGVEREKARLLGPLAAISDRSRETLASIPDLEKVLEDCVVCHECLLKDVGVVSFGVMSFSCNCRGSPAPRMMHVDCIVSMNELTCPFCRSPVVIVAPSLPGERQSGTRTFTVKRSTSAHDEPSAHEEPRGHIAGGEMSPDELREFQRRVSEAAARLRASLQSEWFNP
ncbi:unnamed protein product [Pylaiella littoralis]